MKNWWVNHKQTHKQEIDGGYVWSPKKNRNGSRNETYLNLTRVSPKEKIFSYANTEIKAIGLIESYAVEAARPAEFGSTGNQWDNDGWLVKVRWSLLENPFKPKNHISKIAPLLPLKNSPIQSSGNGNQGCYLAEICRELATVLLTLAKAEDAYVTDAMEDSSDSIDDDVEEGKIQDQDIPPTEKEQLVKARRGQGVFRSRLEKIEKQCRLTGVLDKRFLIASHLKPWCKSSNVEKLDGNNGLLLAPHVDKLLDRGWISFTDIGNILIHHSEIEEIMTQWGLDINANVGKFRQKQLYFLKYHREHVFRT